MITTETDRLRTLHDLYILDTPAEKDFDELVRLTASICGAPISQVSLVDRGRVWAKAAFGIPTTEVCRADTFCTYTIQEHGMFCIEDTLLDERFKDNPFVLGDPNLRFYAGVPLIIRNFAVGTLCVLDRVPRCISAAQKEALTILAHQVQTQLEVRTRQKRLELALLDQQQLALLLEHHYTELDLFFNSVAVILIGLDDAGKITRWNAAASSTFGLSLQEVQQRPLDQCGIVWESTVDLAEWLAHTETGKRIDAVFFTDEGKRWLGMTIQSLSGQHTTSSEYLISATDTTTHRILEDQLRQVHKLNAIGQLAAGIAHEINSPAQFIGDNLSFIKDSWRKLAEVVQAGQSLRRTISEGTICPTLLEAHDAAVEKADLKYVIEELPDAIDQACDGIHRIAGIVNAMKEFSHPGSQKKTLLDVNHCIGTTVALARNEWKYVAEVFTDFDPQLPHLACHASELSQVLLNLIVNAGHAISERKATDPSFVCGRIDILTHHRDEEVEIRIQDNGCGILASISERVFEPFFTTKDVGRGTGQGLAIAHSIIVNKHGGSLWFESPLGGGTCFIIRIPLHDSTEPSSITPLEQLCSRANDS